LNTDAIVVGAGIIGLAVARELSLRGLRVCVVEKESRIAAHQTGRNSGVLHTGVYYDPDGIKARTCRAGYRQMVDFIRDRDLPMEICGKVIVAVDESEGGRLDELERRASANGVQVSRLTPAELAEREPHVQGVAALHVPEAGIVDYGRVAEEFAREVIANDGQFLLNRRVNSVASEGSGWRVETDGGRLSSAYVVNCAGLYSDRVARAAGIEVKSRIVPFHGEYFRLKPAGHHLCRGLIYPVPDPRFPFLGVHFTRTVEGGVLVGPNAVLALSREGYRWRDIRPRDAWDALTYPGFGRLARRHLATGIGEVHRSLSKRAFVSALRKLVPGVQSEWLEPAPAGVRAQSLRPDGTLETEFVILGEGGQAHVCNAPSPGATSSLAIAEHVVGRLLREKVESEGGA
jgi:L-2-hydroxyglutarate oxidase